MTPAVASHGRDLRRLAAALGAGVLAALSLPPWGWWPLGILGLALLARAVAVPRARDRALMGCAFGLGLFAVGLWWVTEFHAVGYVLLLLLETSFFAAGAALVTRPLAFPGAIVLAEAVRGAVPFGGLPLGGLALGQAAGPLAASARLGGALLVLGVIASLGAALGGARRGALLGVAAAAIAVTVAGAAAPLGATNGAIDTAVVQGGGSRGLRAVESDSAEVLAAHLRASEEIEGTPDLVLWPENAIDVVEIDTSDAGRELAELATATGATVVAGVTQDAGDDGFENTAVVWSPEGDIVDRYTKVRRVPFGEYVPLRALLEGLVDLSALPRDAVPGSGDGAVSTPAGRFAVSISYEVFFSDRSRAGVRAGGEVLLVPTNAASFTTSQVPTQEVAAAQLRAWETGRWVLQAAPTGYSAVIDDRGNVRSRSVLGAPALLEAEVPRRTGETLYVRLGDAPVLAAALALALGPLVARRVRGSSP